MAAVDVADDRSSESRARFLVLGFLCLSAAIAYVHRAAITVPAKEIADKLQFDDFEQGMGVVQAAFYFCYAAMQLPGGWLADRIGSRRSLALFCTTWSLAVLACGFATSQSSLLVLWGVMGAAQAGVFPSASKAIGQLFPDHYRARASGFLAFGMGLGGAAAPALAGFFLGELTAVSEQLNIDRWRLLLFLYAVPGLLWTVVFLLVVSRAQLPHRPIVRSTSHPVNWTRMLTDPSLILLCLQQFFRAAAMVFFLTWFPTYLQQTRNVSLEQSGYLTSLAGTGALLGSLCGGFFSDWLLQLTGNARLSRQGIAVVGMLLGSLFIASSYFAADVRVSMLLIAMGAFSATFGGISGYTVAISYGGRHVAIVFSTMNMCGNFGASAFPLAAGWLVAMTGNWHLLLFGCAGILAVDAVCWALLNPQGTLFGDEIEDPQNDRTAAD